jgi:hypothetical protein
MTDPALHRALQLASKAYFRGLGDRPPSKRGALSILQETSADFNLPEEGYDGELREDTPLRELVALAFDATAKEIDDRDHGPGILWNGVVERFSIFLITAAHYAEGDIGLETRHDEPETKIQPASKRRAPTWLWLWGTVLLAIPIALTRSSTHSTNSTLPVPNDLGRTSLQTFSPSSSADGNSSSSSLADSARQLLEVARAGQAHLLPQNDRAMNCSVLRLTLALSRSDTDIQRKYAVECKN